MLKLRSLVATTCIIVFTVSISTTSQAKPLFTITSNSSSVSLSKSGSALINFTVRNTSGKKLTITNVFNNGYNSSLLNSSLTTNNCNVRLNNNDSCTVTSRINAKGIDGITSFELNTCAFNGSICSGMHTKISINITDDFFISGTIQGLTQSGLVLQNNGGDNLSVTKGESQFQFKSSLGAGNGYNVSILQQPSKLTCSVTNGKGRVVDKNIENIKVICLPLYAYVSNLQGGNVNRCIVNRYTGALSQCNDTGGLGFNQPIAITMNQDGSLVFVSNFGDDTVRVCRVNLQTGTFSQCQDTGGTGFNNPTAIAFNPSENIAYVTNSIGATISRCSVNMSNGIFSNCIAIGGLSINGPSGMVLNSSGNLAIITNAFDNSVTRCTVNPNTGVFSNCINNAGLGFNTPVAFTLNTSSTRAFVSNFGNTTVSRCDVNANTGAFSNCSDTNGNNFVSIEGIALNSLNNIAFILNRLAIGRITRCIVNTDTGEFTNCTDSGGTGFSQPIDILIR